MTGVTFFTIALGPKHLELFLTLRSPLDPRSR